jgi:HAD superfamily hydrolase (TIGR01484 family)
MPLDLAFQASASMVIMQRKCVIRKHMTRFMPQQLFASDLDGTLLPPAWTDAARADLRALASRIAGDEVTRVIYVTGRNLAKTLAGVAEGGLPRPDFLACDVGTSVYARRGEDFVLDETYRATMREALGGTSAERIRALLDGKGGLEPQPNPDQGEFKASFYLPAHVNPVDGSALEARLGAAGIRATVVVSMEPETGRGLVDVLPKGVGKDTAVHHVAAVTGVGLESVVFAGDSGNDRAALLAGFRSILVGNAPRSLMDEVRSAARAQGRSDLLYVASAEYVGGVLEGLRHFGLL